MDRFEMPSCRILLEHKSPQVLGLFQFSRAFLLTREEPKSLLESLKNAHSAQIYFQVTLTPH